MSKFVDLVGSYFKNKVYGIEVELLDVHATGDLSRYPSGVVCYMKDTVTDRLMMVDSLIVEQYYDRIENE